MNTVLRLACLILCLIASPLASLRAAEAEPAAAPTADSEYTLTVIPFYGAEKIWALYTPFIDFLKQSTGKPWSLKLFSTHKAVIDGLCSDQVALALLGPVPMARVMEQCQAQPVAVALGKDGTPFYHSVIVSTDPAVSSLDRLRAKRIGFFKGSTAAHILPRAMLRQSGLNTADFIPVFYEGQDQIVNALLTRQVVAAGLKETLFAKFKDDGLRALAISEPVPNFAFAAAPNARPETKKLFADTLLRLKPTANTSDQQQMAAWDDEIKNGFTPPTDTFRAAVRDLLALTNEIMRED